MNSAVMDGIKNLMIIGNGFDLDLGRKSRYSDYRSSRHWPFNHINHNGLGYYIENNAKNNSNWFDIEQLLRDYGDENSKEYDKTNIDYPYFQDFFRSLCESENKDRNNSKKVTIITYDDYSRRQILRQLREMNYRRTNYLFGLNQVDFICTSAKEPKINLKKLDSLINHLTEK